MGAKVNNCFSVTKGGGELAVRYLAVIQNEILVEIGNTKEPRRGVETLQGDQGPGN